MQTRLLSSLAALILASGLGAHPHPEQVHLADQLGLQLWSLRDQFKADALEAMDTVVGYGISEVETAGTANMTPQAFKDALVSRGLDPVSAHVPYAGLKKDFDAVLAEVQALGSSFAMIAWIPHQGDFDRGELEQAIEDFKEWGPKFAKYGIKFGYHPHGYEFVAGQRAGETFLDELIQGTAGHEVYFEMDVFWVVHGGGDPVTLLRQYSDRWVSLHVKDLRKGVETGQTSGHAPATDNVIVGQGMIDWVRVINTARSVGIKHFFIEDETTDPLTNIPASLEFLRNLKL
jgi:sugar phosphate isomerase/epimerase